MEYITIFHAACYWRRIIVLGKIAYLPLLQTLPNYYTVDRNQAETHRTDFHFLSEHRKF